MHADLRSTQLNRFDAFPLVVLTVAVGEAKIRAVTVSDSGVVIPFLFYVIGSEAIRRYPTFANEDHSVGRVANLRLLCDSHARLSGVCSWFTIDAIRRRVC